MAVVTVTATATERRYPREPAIYGRGSIIVVAALVASCHGRCSASSEPAVEDIYALDTLPSFYLELDRKSLRKLEDDPRKFVRGVFRYDEDRYTVGVRLKGHRSMRSMEGKASFKVKFDKYDDDGRFLGQRKLTLNNMVEDPTMMREILGYRLYRAMGVPAPRVGYARVYVNGDLYGLYAMIEAIDEDFLAAHFGDASGGLFEGEYGCDLYPEDVPGFERDAGDESTRAHLLRFAEIAAGPAHELFHADAAPVHKPSVLAYLAVSAFLGDFDGYRHSHNYRVYRDPADGKWRFLPWGIDRVMKKDLSIYDSEGHLARRCFADPACRVDYLRTMERVVAEFERLELAEGARALAAYIDADVRADPRKPFTEPEIIEARSELLSFIGSRPARVRSEMSCLGEQGELDHDGDGFGCMDCAPEDATVHPGAVEVCDGRDNDCSGLADDAAACACPTVDVDGVVFHLCDLPMPWQEAAAFCAGQGLSLARVDSPAQSKALQRAARKVRDDRWWIGLHDRAEEGRFVWADGSPLGVTNWARGEPDNDACNQDCAALKDGGGGRWHDTHCAQHRPFVCR